jgi:ATP/ADP translocase
MIFQCYAWINGISGFMQFFVLPICTQKIRLSWLWIAMPLAMLCLTSMQMYGKQPSLKLVGITFLSMKTIEYSIRGQVSEMVFASLDYESRFIGKQKINLFANRLGKSAMAVSLFLLATYLDKEDSELSQILVLGSNLIAFVWLLSTIQLTKFIEDRKENSNTK